MASEFLVSGGLESAAIMLSGLMRRFPCRVEARCDLWLIDEVWVSFAASILFFGDLRVKDDPWIATELLWVVVQLLRSASRLIGETS